MKEFINAIFCAPTGAYDELPYPSRRTDEVFLALKEAGINRIFGFGYDVREETQLKTLALCEKYEIKYLPTMCSFGEYVDFGWKDLSEERKIELDRRFIEEVKKYAGHKAFAGVFFGDEAGYLSFDGVAHAKRVFDENFPNLEFHFNFFSYSINDAIFWGGMAGSVHGVPDIKKPFELKGDLEIVFNFTTSLWKDFSKRRNSSIFRRTNIRSRGSGRKCLHPSTSRCSSLTRILRKKRKSTAVNFITICRRGNGRPIPKESI